MVIKNKNEVKKTSTINKKSSKPRNTILVWLLILIIVQIILSMTIILSSNFSSNKINTISKKVNAIDNFFRTNVKGYDSSGSNSSPTTTKTTPTVQTNTKTFDNSNSPYIGNPNATVTVVEFLDYQCPFCRRFYTNTYPEIKKNYIDTGKIKFVVRDFPLTSIHPESMASVIAASCAGEQGGNSAYFKMYNEIYTQQNKVGIDRTIFFSSSDLRQWAQNIGLNMNKYDKCIINPAQKTKAQKDEQAGIAAGVTGTPTFFINGKMIVGAQPYNVFKQAIDNALASK